MEELNELEKIGLAFVSGLVAGQSLKESEQEVDNKENEVEIKTTSKLEETKGVPDILKKTMKELGVEWYEQ